MNKLNFNLEYDKSVPRELEVTLYGDMHAYSDSISKCRVRIFYKGLNRNRTYISEEFANQLIESLPYTPVKGIFNKDDVDFEDHGDKNSEGRIYGLVMAEPNFAWEDHVDVDGVIRTYACADVLLYTGLYPEAKIIPESSQSMEINPYTFTGEWKTWDDGLPYYHFYTGSLFGLQVLGMTTEPCFEGAAFYYSLIRTELQPLIDYMKQISEKEESTKMDKILFRLSDNEKAEKIWDAMNPNFNEQGGWKIDNYVLDVYDDYAIAANSEGYKRAYYTKNEDDTVTIDKVEDCYIVDVTETELKALEAMKSVSGTYEAFEQTATENVTEIENLKSQLAAAGASLDEATEKVSAYEAQVAEFETKVAEFEATIAEKETAYTALETEKVELENSKADIISERDELAAYKKSVETSKKNELLAKYSEYLTDEAIEKFKAEIENYSIEDFKKEVCTAAVDNNPTIFEKNGEPEPTYVFKGGDPETGKPNNSVVTGVKRILDNYKNGGNK